ncbi:ATP-binding protein [Oxalobacteraceae bacterium A2-2]
MEKLNHSGQPHAALRITHGSDVAAARRAGAALAREAGLDEVRAGHLAIVLSEAASNIVKHAGEGLMLLRVIEAGERRGIDVLALDQGPGIASLALAMRDGVSSAGTAGTGLGALRRLSDHFDAIAPRGKGAAFHLQVWQAPPAHLAWAAQTAAVLAAAPADSTGPAQDGHGAAAPAIPGVRAGGAPPEGRSGGAASLALMGENVSGDAWAVARQRRATTLMVVDGLGHGSEAAKAAQAAVDALAEQPGRAPAAHIEACHLALRATRGAAVAVAQWEPQARQLRFAGIGNITACLLDAHGRRQLISHNGIVGHNMRKVQEFSLAAAPGDLLVMHSDGISTQWDLAQYPGLYGAAPALAAGVLLRDFSRGRDDACVLVERLGEAP